MNIERGFYVQFGIFRLIIIIIFFISIYFVFRQVLPISDAILAPITIAITLIFSPVVSERLARFRPLSRRLKHINKSLKWFDDKINITNEYHLLLEIFNQFFEEIFEGFSWAFYVNEDNIFRLIKFHSVNKNLLPAQFTQQFSAPPKMIMPLNVAARHFKFKKVPFSKQNLNRLLFFEGKSQTIAFIFLHEKGLSFLQNESTKKYFNQTIRKASQIFEGAALYLDVLTKNRQIRKVFEINEKILSTLNTDDILDFLLESLSEIVSFDAAVIFLLDENSGSLTRKVSKGYAVNIDLDLKIGQGACGWVAQNRETSLLDNVNESEHYYPIRDKTKSQVALPLQVHDELIGVLCLESDQYAYFDESCLEILTIAAHQAAIALNNAKQYEIGIDKKSLEHEMIKAQHVQRVLLPQSPPYYKDLSIAFDHIPSKIVSGDLIDLVPISEKTLGIVIGDVSGKGAHAAIMMSLVLAGFRAYRKTHLAVCEVVARLNNLLEESISDGRYATLVYMLASLGDKTITFTNAGHNSPLLFHTDGNIEHLTDGGIVIGYLPNEAYKQKTVSFKKGDLLVCYTDGLTEALNDNDEEFGEERLISVIKQNLSLNSYDLRNIVLDEVKKFCDGREFSDDLSIVIVKHT
jgi:sigma-B regulation protein RsbU (phosphoserine phosphatase)